MAFHKPYTMPHIVLDPDNAALNLRGRRVWGVAYSSLVLEMPSTLCHEKLCACTAQEQHRPLQGADILGCKSWHTEGNISAIAPLGQS